MILWLSQFKLQVCLAYKLGRHYNYQMFYLIGLGLCDEKDITLKGLEVSLSPSFGRRLRIKAIRRCSRVYLEAYTSILMIEQNRLVSNSRS